MEMTEELKTVTTLDLKGLVCPIPIVKISQAVKQVQVGELVEAIATDPGVLADIPAWCKTSGNELVKMERVDKTFHFVVRRKV
jgi:tRNA 2-thiouridine synthesizing protein A